MRGGALPVLVWAGILAVLFAGNWIWAGDAVQVAEFGFAVLVIALGGALLALANREAVRKGPPPPEREAHTLPDISAGAALASIGLAAAAFGLTFGHFLIYFGAGLFVIGVARLAVERRAERRGPAPRPPAAGDAEARR